MRDLRRYARQTQARLIAGALLILFIVGDGLIFLIYGPEAAGLGLICMAIGLGPVVAIVMMLLVIERVVERANRE